ncbi:11335_t:CDS:2, partial [Ambispora gerdemannii]
MSIMFTVGGSSPLAATNLRIVAENNWPSLPVAIDNQSVISPETDYHYLVKEYGKEVAQKQATHLRSRELATIEYTIYRQNYTNNSDKFKEINFVKDIIYVNNSTLFTTRGFRWGNNLNASGKVLLTKTGAEINFHADWNTSTIQPQKYREDKKIAWVEKFSLSPHSQTEIILTMKEINYESDLSGDIIIEDNNNKTAATKFRVRGKLQGAYGYQLSSNITSKPLNNFDPTPTPIITATATATVTAIPDNGDNYNYLTYLVYYPIGAGTMAAT